MNTMLLTCRSSNANCVAPVVTESMESDNESDADSWTHTQNHNMANNIPEMGWNFKI
jgi:hypothetical protein